MKHYDYSTFPWDTYRVMTASDCPEGSGQEWLFCAAVDFVADGMRDYPALVKAEGMLREVGMVNDVDLRLLVPQVKKWGEARADWIAHSKVDRDVHAFRQNQWVGTGPVPKSPEPEPPVVMKQGTVGSAFGTVDPEQEWARGVVAEDWQAIAVLAEGELERYQEQVKRWAVRLRIAAAGLEG